MSRKLNTIEVLLQFAQVQDTGMLVSISQSAFIKKKKTGKERQLKEQDKKEVTSTLKIHTMNYCTNCINISSIVCCFGGAWIYGSIIMPWNQVKS